MFSFFTQNAPKMCYSDLLGEPTVLPQTPLGWTEGESGKGIKKG